MVTERGSLIGRVNDVVIDETATDDAWAIVSTGVLRSEHFVPLTAAYLAVDGDVVVPYDKSTVKRAPRADDHVLTSPVRKELAELLRHGVAPRYARRRTPRLRRWSCYVIIAATLTATVFARRDVTP